MFRNIFPIVDSELDYWISRAEQIPDPELRTQALSSIKEKRFHCQGGAVYALLAGTKRNEAVRFIISYQTISDYLDNLCDRSTSMNPDDFRLLHDAMRHALTPGQPLENYYRLHAEEEDGGYLAELVFTCQSTLSKLADYSVIQDYVLTLEGMYADLQIHKHVKEEERIARLTNWYAEHKAKTPDLHWYEFAAAAGSTLGIFCLVSYALGEAMSEDLAQSIYEEYFPYMQGLHILLDYFIDQKEDLEEGDLNFCAFYPDQKTMKSRFLYFIEQTDRHVQKLPDRSLHEMIYQGLAGLYLADPKVKQINGGEKIRKALLKASGTNAKFFHWNIRLYYQAQAEKRQI